MTPVFVTGSNNDSSSGYFFLNIDIRGPHRLRKQTAFPEINEKKLIKRKNFYYNEKKLIKRKNFHY